MDWATAFRAKTARGNCAVYPPPPPPPPTASFTRPTSKVDLLVTGWPSAPIPSSAHASPQDTHTHRHRQRHFHLRRYLVPLAVLITDTIATRNDSRRPNRYSTRRGPCSRALHGPLSPRLSTLGQAAYNQEGGWVAGRWRHRQTNPGSPVPPPTRGPR